MIQTVIQRFGPSIIYQTFSNCKIMKNNTFLVCSAITILLALGVQVTQAQEARRVTKLGLYLVDPVSGKLPASAKFVQSIPPITLESERSIVPFLSLGTEFGGTKMDLTVNGLPSSSSESGPFRQSFVSLWGFLKGVVHFNLTDRIEAYAAGGIGYYKSFTSSNNDTFNRALDKEGLDELSGKVKYVAIGTNIMISPKFGFFGEAGLNEAKGAFKVGLVFKK